MTDDISPPKFAVGDKVFMHNHGDEIFTVTYVYPSNTVGKAHRYVTIGQNGKKWYGTGKGYYESTLTPIPEKEKTMARSGININEYNAQLVDQDDELRGLFKAIISTSDDEKMMPEILAEGLCAIHERLGNIAILLLKTGA